jgi:small subunit ribosomal protein S1
MIDNDLLEKWLTETYAYERPRRGETRTGVLLDLDERYGAVIDVGLKHDGLVPAKDIERLDEAEIAELQPGQEVEARVVRAKDKEDQLILSLHQVMAEKDWAKATKLHENDEIYWGEVVGYNRGGLLVQFEHLQGFVPRSHIDTQQRSKELVGQKLPLIILEVDRDQFNLVLSERLARRQLRQQNQARLMDELAVGQVCHGTVRHLTDFGAFIDLGGADGLVHISELAWEHVNHPRELLQVGDEVDAEVIDLDHERERINLSLKRLQPNPWDQVSLIYTSGQLVSGRVTKLVDFGAFVTLEIGVEGLLHVSEIADPPPDDPREFLEKGDELVLRILKIEPARQRISLSLKEVTGPERELWLQREQSEEATAITDSLLYLP